MLERGVWERMIGTDWMEVVEKGVSLPGLLDAEKSRLDLKTAGEKDI